MIADVRHLRLLDAIARAGTITGAAAVLHISQPAATRLLQQLEEHLGARLVERSTHHLRFTSTGQAYRRRVQSALVALDAVLDPGRMEVGPLRVGHAWSAFGAVTAALLSQWRVEHPDVPLQLLRVDQRDGGLSKGVVDAAVVRDLPPGGPLDRALLTHEPRVAAVSATSPMAQAEMITLGELAGQPLVVNTVSGTTDSTLWATTRPPSTIIEVGNTDDWLMLIASGSGAGISGSATAAMHPNPDVVYIPMVDVPPITVELAWIDGSHPAILDLIDLAFGLMQTVEPSDSKLHQNPAG